LYAFPHLSTVDSVTVNVIVIVIVTVIVMVIAAAPRAGGKREKPFRPPPGTIKNPAVPKYSRIFYAKLNY